MFSPPAIMPNLPYSYAMVRQAHHERFDKLTMSGLTGLPRACRGARNDSFNKIPLRLPFSKGDDVVFLFYHHSWLILLSLFRKEGLREILGYP
jgi:hypothetical protein